MGRRRVGEEEKGRVKVMVRGIEKGRGRVYMMERGGNSIFITVA